LNHTLDSDPRTFPLDRAIYADFTHDKLVAAVVSALGLFKDPEDTFSAEEEENGAGEGAGRRRPSRRPRSWIFSRISPFAGRVVTERLTCGGGAEGKRQYVRIFVNDAIQLLDFCNKKAVGNNDDTLARTLCEVDAFVESQAYARENGRGDYERCFKGR
jgi:hypothetical protein